MLTNLSFSYRRSGDILTEIRFFVPNMEEAVEQEFQKEVQRRKEDFK